MVVGRLSFTDGRDETLKSAFRLLIIDQVQESHGSVLKVISCSDLKTGKP